MRSGFNSTEKGAIEIRVELVAKQLSAKNSQVFGVRFEYLDRSKSEGSSGSLRS